MLSKYKPIKRRWKECTVYLLRIHACIFSVRANLFIYKYFRRKDVLSAEFSLAVVLAAILVLVLVVVLILITVLVVVLILVTVLVVILVIHNSIPP